MAPRRLDRLPCGGAQGKVGARRKDAGKLAVALGRPLRESAWRGRRASTPALRRHGHLFDRQPASPHRQRIGLHLRSGLASSAPIIATAARAMHAMQNRRILRDGLPSRLLKLHDA